ncbi:LysR substrate-binding domain-containing protein [Kushneria aurantia]|uniref:LysR substrate-binding domain-containing protein n=1 Tax=Kushneria aurantia TaxID=504092 RepID=A0ABV6G7T9_9GAMM|nr:LysR substrate-binding domain-containing protein [Kushneria aurantia]
MSTLPPLAWMQAFEASARHLNFTAAGEELGVSQAAISQRIRLLEARVGQSLFIRHPRSLSLSDAGRAWLPSVQEAFMRLAQGTAEVFGPDGRASVTLRATPGVQQYWLAQRLCRFHQRYPDIEVHIVTAIWSQQFGGVDADLEIRYGVGDWPEVEGHSLGREELSPLCAPALARRLKHIDDLAGETLLHATGFTTGWPAWLRAFGADGVEHRARRLVCDTRIMTLRLAASGCGVALAQRRLTEDSQALVAPFEGSIAASEAFWLVHPRGRALSASASTLWQWLVAEADEPAVQQALGSRLSGS